MRKDPEQTRRYQRQWYLKNRQRVLDRARRRYLQRALREMRAEMQSA